MLNMRHVLIGAVAIVGLLSLIAVLVSYLGSFTEVKVLTVPQNATVQLESGKILHNDKTNRLRNGTYNVTVSREGYTDKNLRLVVDGRADTNLAAILEPKTDEAKRELLGRSNQKTITAIESLPGGVFKRSLDISDGIKAQSCQSLRFPSDKSIKALCITGLPDSDYRSVILSIPERSYLEILYGSPSLYNVYTDQNVDVSFVSTLKTDKPVLYIDVIDKDLLARGEEDIIQTIRTSLINGGYNPDSYYYTYGNEKLVSRSTIPSELDDEENHMHAPYEVPGVPRE